MRKRLLVRNLLIYLNQLHRLERTGREEAINQNRNRIKGRAREQGLRLKKYEDIF